MTALLTHCKTKPSGPWGVAEWSLADVKTPRAGDEASAVRRLARNRGTALLATSGVAFALVTATLDGPELDRCLELFEPLNRDARMNAENHGRLGDGFLDEAAPRSSFCTLPAVSTRPPPMA